MAQLENTDIIYFGAPGTAKQHLKANLLTAVTTVVVGKQMHKKSFLVLNPHGIIAKN